jgi:FkbM family methyltransferase
VSQLSQPESVPVAVSMRRIRRLLSDPARIPEKVVRRVRRYLQVAGSEPASRRERPARERPPRERFVPVTERDAFAAVGEILLLVPEPLDRTVARRLVTTGVTEPAFTKLAQRVVTEGSGVADVGASIGYFTCLFADWTGPRGKVIAFEPWPVSLQYLHANIAGNAFRHVIVDTTALFDSSGPGYVSTPSYRVTPGEANDAHAMKVDLQRFDEIPAVRALKRLDAIKIDIEGAELRALEGMRASIARWQPVLLLEVHPQFLPIYGDSLEQLHAFISDIGYESQVVEEGASMEAGHHLIAAPALQLEALRSRGALRPQAASVAH